MQSCYRLLSILILIFSASPTLLHAETAVMAEDAWVREAPPASTVLAAYMVLRNAGDLPTMITSISSPDFEKAEIHRTVMDDGVAKMLPVEALELPADSRVALEPGGLHLMLFNPVHAVKQGDRVTLIIHENSDQTIMVTAPVKRMTGGVDHSHHH